MEKLSIVSYPSFTQIWDKLQGKKIISNSEKKNGIWSSLSIILNFRETIVIPQIWGKDMEARCESVLKLFLSN